MLNIIKVDSRIGVEARVRKLTKYTVVGIVRIFPDPVKHQRVILSTIEGISQSREIICKRLVAMRLCQVR